jgi:hypothetical protein
MHVIEFWGGISAIIPLCTGAQDALVQAAQ